MLPIRLNLKLNSFGDESRMTHEFSKRTFVSFFIDGSSAGFGAARYPPTIPIARAMMPMIPVTVLDTPPSSLLYPIAGVVCAGYIRLVSTGGYALIDLPVTTITRYH